MGADDSGRIHTYLGGLANLLTNGLPFVILIFLNGGSKSLTLVLGKLGVVHILK